MIVVLLSVLYISHSSFRCDGDTLLLQTYCVNRFIENIFSLSREMLLRIPLHLLKKSSKSTGAAWHIPWFFSNPLEKYGWKYGYSRTFSWFLQKKKFSLDFRLQTELLTEVCRYFRIVQSKRPSIDWTFDWSSAFRECERKLETTNIHDTAVFSLRLWTSLLFESWYLSKNLTYRLG